MEVESQLMPTPLATSQHINPPTLHLHTVPPTWLSVSSTIIVIQMASSIHLLALSAATLLLLLQCQAAATASAPAPSASGRVNLTDILTKNGAYSTFIRLLMATQVATQVDNQLNSSTNGMTVFAPDDNAFNSLKAGTLNSLTNQQQVQLVLYHVLPDFYNWDKFQTASNPINTQASGRTGNWGVNITTFGVQQANISTGVIQTPINNALSQKFPLAVYQLEKVLLPDELFGPKANAPVESPATTASSSSAKANSTAASPSTSSNEKNAAAGTAVGFSFLAGIGVFCMAMVF